MASAIVFEDKWGEIIDRPEADCLELRWFDTTSTLSKDEFQQWLARYAEQGERSRRSRMLVDATTFRMNPAYNDGPWRDEHIVPRYNAAGVKKFAFHFPDGIPLIGKTPEYEGPAKYLTGYFGRRQDALDWFAR